MKEEAAIFESIYADYLAQVARLDVAAIADQLGVEVQDDEIRIPFFHKAFSLTPRGIADEKGHKPHHALCVVLCKYLLLCPAALKADEALATYKDFKDGAPYVMGFKNTAERPIARYFSGHAEALVNRCLHLGAKPYQSDIACQMAFEFAALPRVPLYLLFNDADEEFPAQCTLLFRKSAADYLDMECIAMVGSILASWLTNPKA
jgi:hypothetical protein